MKKMACTIYVAKTKALIRCAGTAKLICVFVFAYVDCWLSYVAALLCCFCKYHCAQKMYYDSKSVENLIDCDSSMLWGGGDLERFSHFSSKNLNKTG